MFKSVLALLTLFCLSGACRAEDFAAIDRLFADFALDEHIPGLVYGVVIGGQLVHVQGFGEQDIASHRPVTADTLFRIASMTKAFTALTILKLRDDGKLRLDDLAESYVPEMRSWHYPTQDSRRIRVRDLLNHIGGFVTDNPWGDRQTPLPEADFTKLLQDGPGFTRDPGMAYEYSNLGFAILGRIIGNLSAQPFETVIGQTLLQPLAMASSGFDAAAAPAASRALGYRWEGDSWRPEPLLGPGAFGAMGGLQTSARDYAKWLSFLLSAWPPRDGAEAGPVRRATVRELAEGSNFPRFRSRFGDKAPAGCRQAVTYAMGFNTAMDCDLGLTLSHGGGYPGYGSHVLLLPERGIAIFAFANRTYGAPAAPVWQAALMLQKSGRLPDIRAVPISPQLSVAHDWVKAIYRDGTLKPALPHLAMNFLLDRDETGWASELRRLNSEMGACNEQSDLTASGLLSGDFIWRCAHGHLRGHIELAPVRRAELQTLEFLEPK